MSLTAVELERGWVEFHCGRHGFLVATIPEASAWCKCGKRARRLRHGRLLDPETLKPTAAKARKLNGEGQPYIHGCGDCGEDFHGRTLQTRHRVGPKKTKRCLTPSEMGAKGWHRDGRGRWRGPAPLQERAAYLASRAPKTPSKGETKENTVSGQNVANEQVA